MARRESNESHYPDFSGLTNSLLPPNALFPPGWHPQPWQGNPHGLNHMNNIWNAQNPMATTYQPPNFPAYDPNGYESSGISAPSSLTHSDPGQPQNSGVRLQKWSWGLFRYELTE